MPYRSCKSESRFSFYFLLFFVLLYFRFFFKFRFVFIDFCICCFALSESVELKTNLKTYGNVIHNCVLVAMTTRDLFTVVFNYCRLHFQEIRTVRVLHFCF